MRRFFGVLAGILLFTTSLFFSNSMYASPGALDHGIQTKDFPSQTIILSLDGQGSFSATTKGYMTADHSAEQQDDPVYEEPKRTYIGLYAAILLIILIVVARIVFGYFTRNK